MAKITTFYKLVQPQTTGEAIVDSNQDLVGAGSYSNNAWYQNVIKGVTSRMVQYQQYTSMDSDVEVTRALNTIAEEMTGNDPKTNEPINIELLTTDKTKYDSSEVLTLKAALSRWNDIHDWESKLFSICRNVVKFGDVFFRKPKDKFDRKWEYVDPQNVVAAACDPNDITRVVAWQIRSEVKQPKHSLSPIQKNVNGSNEHNTVWVPASEMVQFTLNDEMSESAPFGISILASVYKAFKQKELMEDATIIYRVQRAPERRVFYIDVGNVPAQRAKAQIEQYKNDIKQKKIPSFNGGKQTVDAVYNPQSMNEDFFMAVRPEGRGSRIESLPGGTGGGDTDELEYFQRRLWEGLNIPTSYMSTSDDGGQAFNDGKVGVAYIQELRFAQFIGRLQRHVECILDTEFKKWLKAAGIHIDPLLYRLRLPSPSNFGKYRQQEMDGNLLGQYGTADATDYLSKRFIMSRYLQLTDEEIVMNDRMKREEMGIPLDDNSPDVLKQIYGGSPVEDLDGGYGGESIDTTSETEDLGGDEPDVGDDVGDEATETP